MHSTALDTEIKKYLPLLESEEKMTLLTVIRSFLNLKANAAPINTDQYNKEIDEAMARMEKGKYTTHEDVEKEMDAW